MPQIDSDKYNRLKLTKEYLTDPLLMALAWKKSHDYIRTTNWYADNFELDKSALNLAEQCTNWTAEIASGRVLFNSLKLVPAPKTTEWTFIKNKIPDAMELQLGPNFEILDKPSYCLTWAPIEANDLKLRPLAHIGIKEQTMMTLTMMCLANDVEALQGDPSTKYEEVHDKNIVSYGNRLYCTYSEDSEGNLNAEHTYGATTTYSKYFTDYRKFLQRPYHFASKALPEKSPDEEVYLIELDLSQFFDRINREDLLDKIEKIVSTEQEVAIKPEDPAATLFKSFSSWSWSKCAIKAYDLCATDEIPKPLDGLPQGLFASGFLSNIYMLDFDNKMQESINQEIPSNTTSELTLIDYCRYVDDMRLVVTGPTRSNSNSNSIKIIKDEVKKWLDPEFKKLGLELNHSKTKVEVYRGKSKGISNALEDIQSNLSGPLSLESADELVTQLESLLMLSKSKPQATKEDDSCFPNRLESIEKNIFDIREDTLKRFAANKITRILSEKRHFTSRKTDKNGNPIPGDWDYLQERVSRRLVASWSYDPALVLLLKKGLELFPSPKLLEPVLEQLKELRARASSYSAEEKKTVLKQAAIAEYCLAEIFRHSATIIYRKDSQAIPAHADIDGYFELLQSEAAKLLTGKQHGTKSDDCSTNTEFDLLIEQARFLLLVKLDTIMENSCGNAEQDLIFKLAKGFRVIPLNDLIDSDSLAVSILLASQLVEDQKPVLRAACCLLDENDADAERILTRMAAQNPDLVRSLLLHARAIKYGWYIKYKTGFIEELVNQLYLNIKPSTKPLNEITKPTGIYQLSSRNDNPFSNEIMALKLFLALLNKFSEISIDDCEVIDLSRTKVQLEKGYRIPPSYSVFDDKLEIKKIELQKALSGLAQHLTTPEKSPQKLQRIALAIRAVLAGSADPTGFGQSYASRAGYSGLKTTSFKRQFGMMTTPESLAGEAAQFSTWLSTLLAKLLRWPGIHVNEQGFDWPREFTFNNVKDLINKRLGLLKQAYCQLSEMPMLPELISPSWNEDKKSLKVAMVQSKLPFKKDFTEAGTMLDVNEYRVKHRRHVARVAQLVVKHIEAQHIDECKEGEREQDIDLIIWPELAVHHDDIDILVHLSRKTHAIVLSGLTFINQPGVSGPNNCAVWIVPRKHNGNQAEIKRFQGKFHMMEGERKLNIQSWRPYQLMLELKHPKFKNKQGFKLTSATCFDATDIKLSADLRDKSNALCIPALNPDVNSFDTMVDALHYHMYQHVILVNTGEFGGSYAKAPYDKPYKRLIAHSTGNNQIAINTFEMNMFDFRRDGVGKSMTSGIDTKTPPAGVPLKD